MVCLSTWRSPLLAGALVGTLVTLSAGEQVIKTSSAKCAEALPSSGCGDCKLVFVPSLKMCVECFKDTNIVITEDTVGQVKPHAVWCAHAGQDQAAVPTASGVSIVDDKVGTPYAAADAAAAAAAAAAVVPNTTVVSAPSAIAPNATQLNTTVPAVNLTPSVNPVIQQVPAAPANTTGPAVATPGCPVIAAMPRGATAELVDPGVNGFGPKTVVIFGIADDVSSVVAKVLQPPFASVFTLELLTPSGDLVAKLDTPIGFGGGEAAIRDCKGNSVAVVKFSSGGPWFNPFLTKSIKLFDAAGETSTGGVKWEDGNASQATASWMTLGALDGLPTQGVDTTMDNTPWYQHIRWSLNGYGPIHQKAHISVTALPPDMRVLSLVTAAQMAGAGFGSGILCLIWTAVSVMMVALCCLCCKLGPSKSERETRRLAPSPREDSSRSEILPLVTNQRPPAVKEATRPQAEGSWIHCCSRQTPCATGSERTVDRLPGPPSVRIR